MFVLRRVAEILFGALFRIARVACFAQAVALAGSGALAGVIASGEAPPEWVRWAGPRAALLFATFLATAILMQWLAWRRAADEFADTELAAMPAPAPSPRSSWFVPSLAGLSALAVWQSAGLFALWRDVVTLLGQFGPWDITGAEAQYSGYILAPLFVALYVPALEAGAAFTMIAPPLALLLLVALRSPAVPRLYLLMTVCQAGLALAGLLTADLFARLANELTPEVLAAGDDFGPRVVAELDRAGSVLTTTALALLAPLAGYLAWVPSMLREQAPRR